MKTLLLLLLPFLTMAQTIQVRTPLELSQAISNKYDCRIMNDMDLTGVTLPIISSRIYGSNKKMTVTKLPISGESFLFTISQGSMDSLTISGPNGNVMADGGFFGAIKIVSGNLTAINFINCDKFGVYVVGSRPSLTDSTFITSCTFTNINRLGYGYGIWNNSGTCIIKNSVFQDCRHFFDCSSDNWIYDISGCTFAATHYNYGLHHHMYPDTTVTAARSGAGFFFRNNYVLGSTVPFEGYRSKTGRTLFENNYFESVNIGLLSGVPVVSDSLVWRGNKIGGNGMLIRPTVVSTDTVRVGEKITYLASGYTKLVFPDSKPSAYYASPRCKTFSVYGVKNGVRSLTKYNTITVRDTGTYKGFALKVYKCTVEVLSRDGVLIARLKPTAWTSYLYRKDVVLKVVGQVGGECYIDDYVTGTSSEPFETTNKIRVYNYSTSQIKAGRFIGESFSGDYSFKFTFPVSGTVNFE